LQGWLQGCWMTLGATLQGLHQRWGGRLHVLCLPSHPFPSVKGLLAASLMFCAVPKAVCCALAITHFASLQRANCLHQEPDGRFTCLCFCRPTSAKWRQVQS
jgi:hypothetical protein